MFRGKAVEKAIGVRPGFRMRGREVSRLEGLSDAVFGFAITLLVVSLEVPRTFTQLLEVMRGFPAFAAAFAILFLIWFHQYRFFRHFGLQDLPTIWLNAVLLFVVLFFVYPLKFVFNFVFGVLVMGGDFRVRLPDGTVADVVGRDQAVQMMVVYGLGYVAIFALFALLYLHAHRKRAELDLTPWEEHETLGNVRENLLNVGIGLLSIGIATRGPQWAGVAGVAYGLTGPVLWWNGRRWGKRWKALEARTLPAG